MTLRSRALRIAVATGAERADVYLTADMLAEAAGITRGTLARLVHAGLVEPASPGGSVFTAAMAARLRRMLRLRSDLGVNLVGAAIILDLVERLDELHAQSKEKR